MAFTSLIDVDALQSLSQSADVRIIDCRFVLSTLGGENNDDKGKQAYLNAHIPGALYLHLNEQMSAPVQAGVTGRHPLPDKTQWLECLNACGIDESTQVVAYDDVGGAMAARLWWLLRWCGHEAVAVLDGGWQAWCKEDLPSCTGEESVKPLAFHQKDSLVAWWSSSKVAAALDTACLIDSRDQVRFSGRHEPIDPVAGHIPGALCLPFLDNLAEDGRFLPKEQLRQRFQWLSDQAAGRELVFYCGSGVTAAHNVLAMAHAGFDAPALYAGSWSEWITDPQRPIARA